ncbi:hypothetical protein M407DRAFT_241033 [Tulasnella calospora MUT 4182]|uniref:Uncharacterized protein n=1 Tax=Tulasnella calospora MUT 4182 TaxID=1051891 RepID=A0A0C3LHF3_9AGAM|nr:hypothetical protein M407DRAFT_241033 [Tulasnella calospora MUT 4182]
MFIPREPRSPAARFYILSEICFFSEKPRPSPYHEAVFVQHRAIGHRPTPPNPVRNQSGLD